MKLIAVTFRLYHAIKFDQPRVVEDAIGSGSCDGVLSHTTLQTVSVKRSFVEMLRMLTSTPSV